MRRAAPFLALIFIVLIFITSCGTPSRTASVTSSDNFNKLTSDYVYGTLALSPVSATQNGYHTHQGMSMDEALDDTSAAAIAAQRAFLVGIQNRMGALDAKSLDKEQAADLEIMKSNIGLSLLEIDSIQSYKHNPTGYVELAGSALFGPYVLNYAPQEKRFGHIIKRLEKMPTLFEQAKANLTDSPEVWNRVAQQENQGNIDLIDKTLRDAAPASMKADYTKAAGPAIAAMRGFNAWLKDTLSKKTSDWRLGKEKYARKFEFALTTGKTPEQLLSEAEAELKTTQAEMAKLAAPKTIQQALDDIAKQHSTPASYLEDARKDLEQATAFVREKNLLTLPARANLQVIETPEFMRGIYGVGGFNPAPALEPQLGAFYWITPIDKTWSKERVESKLREYNTYGLQHLTVHEAMPGHYVQFEYANDVQPLERRLLRAIFGNTPYVEGWGFYTQQMMPEQGYLSSQPGMQLTFYKQLLRVLANTILDVRLQTMGMTDKEALDLMINQTYQEREEAVAKLQRAQLSSCQLPSYFAGWKGWLEARELFKKKQGSAYAIRDFHERALKESAVPLPVLNQLLLN